MGAETARPAPAPDAHPPPQRPPPARPHRSVSGAPAGRLPHLSTARPARSPARVHPRGGGGGGTSPTHKGGGGGLLSSEALAGRALSARPSELSLGPHLGAGAGFGGRAPVCPIWPSLGPHRPPPATDTHPSEERGGGAMAQIHADVRACVVGRRTHAPRLVLGARIGVTSACCTRGGASALRVPDRSTLKTPPKRLRHTAQKHMRWRRRCFCPHPGPERRDWHLFRATLASATPQQTTLHCTVRVPEPGLRKSRNTALWPNQAKPVESAEIWPSPAGIRLRPI